MKTFFKSLLNFTLFAIIMLSVLWTFVYWFMNAELTIMQLSKQLWYVPIVQICAMFLLVIVNEDKTVF